MYAATPTDETPLQGATRSNSLSQIRQKVDVDGTYSIRLTPFIDHSSNSPALYFGPILRKTKPGSRLSIGRYTDKVREAAQAPPGSDAPVVFKSKVVSRTHAEFYVDDFGNWYIKDLKSSSGTFLNHIRLSPAGVESMDTPLQNGDVLQLGMDFRGGIEDIFRCVKMRVETNKSWQRKANQFNKEAHERLKSLALLDETELSECAICLLKVKPCQAVFISPCSHCWHYKCIRPIVVKSYPQFLCPNCRETCDLEADLEESETEHEDNGDDILEEESDEDIEMGDKAAVGITSDDDPLTDLSG
jgi:pSer/pThr/pTyr-binding forkhead associated (FHA) protein